MGRVNASTLATTPPPAAPAAPREPAPATKTAAPPPAPRAQAAPAPALTGSVVGDRILSGRGPEIERMGLTFGPLPGPAAEPPPGPARGAPTGFYSTQMREVQALRERRALGPKETTLPMVPGYRSASAYGGAGSTGGTVTLPAAGDYSLKMEPKPGLPRTFSARPTPEAMTVTTSNQDEFVRRGERLGERYASLQRTLLDLADLRRELETEKKAGATPETAAGATTDERLKSLARRTRSVNQDMAQTLANLREFGIDEREAEEQYGSR